MNLPKSVFVTLLVLGFLRVISYPWYTTIYELCPVDGGELSALIPAILTFFSLPSSLICLIHSIEKRYLIGSVFVALLLSANLYFLWFDWVHSIKIFCFLFS